MRTTVFKPSPSHLAPAARCAAVSCLVRALYPFALALRFYVRLHRLAPRTTTAKSPFTPIFRQGRTAEEFLAESANHGWPSFRDSEVVWDSVRVLTRGQSAEGETITAEGVHLGHNLPDAKGNRYCINLVCVAGPGPAGGPAVDA